MEKIIIPIIISFLATVLLAPGMIRWLKKLKFGQQILEDGPAWHEKKAGTPTMGGLIFIAGVLLSIIVALFVKFDINLLTMFLVQ